MRAHRSPARSASVLGSRQRRPGRRSPRSRTKPITAEERAHWAFQPLEAAAGPDGPRIGPGSATRSTPSSWRGSRPSGLRPSPEADRATLLRRLSFDLTGLPPTPEEIDAFLERSLARRLREGRRPPAGEPSVRRALGPALARPGAVRRHRRLRVRPGPAQRLAVSRLGGRQPESRPALRPVRPPAAGRRRDRARRSRRLHRDRLQSLLSRHGRPQRPGAAAAECAERHHRDRRAWSSSV